MNYDQFCTGIKYFNQKKWRKRRGPSYDELVKKGGNYWLHLERMSEDDLRNEILRGFLNTPRWGCRVSYKSVPALKEAVKQLPGYYTALGSVRIEDINFQGCSTLEGEISNAHVIDRIVSLFRQITPKFGSVPTSKLMHMACPDLFVMWDEKIREKYSIPRHKLPGLDKPKWWYTAFLLLMQEQISHIIETYPEPSVVGRQAVIGQIMKEHNLPMPRLLDMANMAVRDGKLQVCEMCIRKAKTRWGELE